MDEGNDVVFRAGCAIVDGIGTEDPRPSALEVRAVVDTPEQAQRIRALFPKSVGLRAGALGSYEGKPLTASYRRVTKGYVELNVQIAADGVNGGVNETGLKRYRRFRTKAADLGIAVEWTTPYLNSIQTEDEFEGFLAGDR